MNILKDLYFKDIDAFVKSVLEQYKFYKEAKDIDEFNGVSIVASYEVMIGILNNLVKNSSFEMKNVNLEEGECRGYYDEWILTLDPEEKLWIQVAKYDTGYIFTGDDIVYVHGDVNSAFVKKNEEENLVVFDFIDDDNCKTDSSSSESTYISRNSDGIPCGFTKTWFTTENNVDYCSSYSHYTPDPDVLHDIAEQFGVKF